MSWLTKSEIKNLTSVVHLQPMPEESLTENQFEDATIGMNIPKNFIPSIEKVMMSVFTLVIIIINNGNRTEWSPIWSVIIRVINKIGRPRSGSPIC